MGEEKSSQCDPPFVHCFLDGRFDCECGAERHDEVLADMIFALTMMESHGQSPGAARVVDGAAVWVSLMIAASLVAALVGVPMGLFRSYGILLDPTPAIVAVFALLGQQSLVKLNRLGASGASSPLSSPS